MESKKTIECSLINQKNEEGLDVVVLHFEDDFGDIDFNDDDQENIKSLFNNLLKELISYDITIEFNDSNQDIKPAFLKDVAEEYVAQLNKELEIVKEHLSSRFDTEESD